MPSNYSLGQTLYYGDETLYMSQYALNRSVTTNQIQITKLTKLKSSFLKAVETQVIFLKKLVGKKDLTPVNINTVKNTKFITKSTKIVVINSFRLIKQKTISFKFVLINVANTRKQKQSNLKATEVNATSIRKTKNAVLRIVQGSSTFLKKSISKSSRVVYVQKAGEIGETLYRLISVVVVGGIKKSKSVSKGIKTNLVQNIRTNKSKITSIKFTQIQIFHISKFYPTVVKVLNTFITKINKRKAVNFRVLNVQNFKINKLKSTIIRSTRILTTRLKKSKSTKIKSTQIQISKTAKLKKTLIKATNILTLRIKKQKNTTIKPTQMVSATVTKATHRRRGSTANITYTIASTRKQTLYRKLKATTVNTLGLNKGIKKHTKVSNTNISLISREKVFWEFLVQIVTKITSFNRQIIKKPYYGRPDPDNWDPNMVDTSTPGVEGLVDNGLDEDNFND